MKTYEQQLEDAKSITDFMRIAANHSGPALEAERIARARPGDEAAQQRARDARHRVQTAEMLAMQMAANDRLRQSEIERQERERQERIARERLAETARKQASKRQDLGRSR